MAGLFIGPAYELRQRKAAYQRAVNLYLSGLETPDKSPFLMESAPGLILRATIGGECRGMIENADGRTFAVYGSTLYELLSDYTATARGTLFTSTGTVSLAYGLFQLVLVDGPNGYVFTLSDNTFQSITADGFYGSATVRFISNFFSFIRPDTQQQYIAAVNDATSFDPLDFISAEQSPDNLVSQEVLNSVLWLFGTLTTEFLFLSGGADYPFSSNGQGALEVGCLAPHSVRQMAGGTIVWLGRTIEGAGVVYRSVGYEAQRISTQAVEQSIQASTDMSAGVAYIYQKDGLFFYCLNLPGVDATWCYELTTGTWHERCDVGPDGEYQQARETHHLYAFGVHLVGDAAGKLYELSDTTYTKAGDVLMRERTSPHASVPSLSTVFFKRFILDCTTGERGQRTTITDGLNLALDQRRDDYKVELSWADWKANRALQWSNPIQRSIGYVGQTVARLLWGANVLGRSQDRVWRVRFSDNAPFAIIAADVEAEVGTD